MKLIASDNGRLFVCQPGLRSVAIMERNGDVRRLPMPSRDDIDRHYIDIPEPLRDFWDDVYRQYAKDRPTVPTQLNPLGI